MFTFTPDLKYYFQFMANRMEVYWSRLAGLAPPWTTDKILAEHRFTNVYRVLDRESQFLIKRVLYSGENFSPEDTLFRVLVFRHFNLGKTWDIIEQERKKISINTSHFFDISEICRRHYQAGTKLYSGAYLQTASFLRGPKYGHLPKSLTFTNKWDYYFHIYIEEIFQNGYYKTILASKSLQELFENLKSVTCLGDFLAMQLAIDLNYSKVFDFDENEFIVAGLGAVRGIDKTFVNLPRNSHAQVISWIHENFQGLLTSFGFQEKFQELPGRPPTLIDLQNCFCETDKYLRAVYPGKDKIKQKYIPGDLFNPPKTIEKPFFPPKWGVTL